MTTSCLVIGLGNIGALYDIHLDRRQYVLTHARAISLLSGFDLVAGADQSSYNRKTFTEHYSVPAFEDFVEPIKKFEPELIVIATPTETHKEVLEQVLSIHVPKTILCEKPLAYCLSDAQKMVNLSAEKCVDLLVNYIRRCDPGVLAARELILSGELQPPFRGSLGYNGGLYNNATHLVDLMEFWFGEVCQCFPIVDSTDNEPMSPAQDMVLQFENGQVQLISANHCEFGFFEADILFTNGRLQYQSGGDVAFWCKTVERYDFIGESKLENEKRLLPTDLNRYQLNVYRDIENRFSGNTNFLGTGESTLNFIEKIGCICP